MKRIDLTQKNENETLSSQKLLEVINNLPESGQISKTDLQEAYTKTCHRKNLIKDPANTIIYDMSPSMVLRQSRVVLCITKLLFSVGKANQTNNIEIVFISDNMLVITTLKEMSSMKEEEFYEKMNKYMCPLTWNGIKKCMVNVLNPPITCLALCSDFNFSDVTLLKKEEKLQIFDSFKFFFDVEMKRGDRFTSIIDKHKFMGIEK